MLDSDPNYLTQVLPAMLLLGVGLSMTVAPLTTTVLDSVYERHVGVASGVNNAVSRVAQVLAIAALGAVVSAQFASTLDDRTAGQQLSAEASSAIETAKEQPLSGGDVGETTGAEAAALDADILDSSESAFHVGMLLGAVLMAVGGVIALLGVRNPEHAARARTGSRPRVGGDRRRVRTGRRPGPRRARAGPAAESRALLTPGGAV